MNQKQIFNIFFQTRPNHKCWTEITKIEEPFWNGNGDGGGGRSDARREFVDVDDDDVYDNDDVVSPSRDLGHDLQQMRATHSRSVAGKSRRSCQRRHLQVGVVRQRRIEVARLDDGTSKGEERHCRRYSRTRQRKVQSKDSRRRRRKEGKKVD